MFWLVITGLEVFFGLLRSLNKEKELSGTAQRVRDFGTHLTFMGVRLGRGNPCLQSMDLFVLESFRTSMSPKV
jgi:hypothetical protein